MAEGRTVKVYSFYAAMRPVVHAYLTSQVTRREFITRINQLKKYR